MKVRTMAFAVLVIPMLAACALRGAQTDTVSATPALDVGEPLRAAHVCRGPDGDYHLTGTLSTPGLDGKPDFDNNRGVRLWQSEDLTGWTDLGYAWDMVEVAKNMRNATTKDFWYVPEGRISGYPAHATSAPELHYIKETYWICYSMNGQGTVLLKSKSGKPEGPYEDIGYITSRGGNASMFEDEDGKVYWLFADAWIAKIKPDMTGLAEKPRPLLPTASAAPGEGRYKFPRGGTYLFRKDDRYHLAYADWTVRDGKPSYDAHFAVSDDIYGPYAPLDVRLRGTGPISVFHHADGDWMASYSDRRANRPAVIRIPFER